MTKKMGESPLLTLGKSWERALRAGTATQKQARKPASPYTIRNYRKTLRLLNAYLVEYLAEGLEDTPAEEIAPELKDATPGALNEWLDDVAEETSSGNALHHYRNATAFYAWAIGTERLLQAGENPMLYVTPPRPNDTARPPLTTDQVAAMIKTCGGRGFENVRDEAIIRVLADTGMRLGGLVGLTYHPDHSGLDNAGYSDVFLDHDPALLRLRLKGGKTHLVDISTRTAAALDRYLRARARHEKYFVPSLWLGKRGPLGRTGVQRMIHDRGFLARIPDRVHPHRFRRSMATWHLDAGGSRDALKSRAGWSSDSMINVYVSDSRDRLAWQESQRLGLADRY